LAEMFDTKEYLPALGTVRRVEIGFAGSGFPPPPAWLLAGWLASRLSWAPAGASSKGLVFRSGSGDVLVAMTGDRRGEGRALERIRIQAEEPHPLDLEFTHQGREATATIVTRAPRARRTEVPFDYREFAACIVGEIHRVLFRRRASGSPGSSGIEFRPRVPNAARAARAPGAPHIPDPGRGIRSRAGGPALRGAHPRALRRPAPGRSILRSRIPGPGGRRAHGFSFPRRENSGRSAAPRRRGLDRGAPGNAGHRDLQAPERRAPHCLSRRGQGKGDCGPADARSRRG